MDHVNSKKEEINQWYSLPRAYNGEKINIYDIWENGGALNDSVTPSTYSKLYKSHMIMKIMSLLKKNSQVFSIGCGNAVI